MSLEFFLVAAATHDFLTVEVLDNSADLVAIVDDLCVNLKQ